MLQPHSELNGIKALPDDLNIVGLTCDSRKVRPGFLFAALTGSSADGRAFIAQALQAGATAILAPTGTQLPKHSAARLIEDDNTRRRFSQMAAAFYHEQPAIMTAVTGTNGKTSTADFTRQIWGGLGHKAASIGTLGIIAPTWDNAGGLTTPDPETLHANLANLAALGIDHGCIEASSHGLSQYRLDGVRLTAAAFTNLTRDHLDYHGSMTQYGQAKHRLFSEVLPLDGVAVINADSPDAAQFIAAAAQRKILTYGLNGSDIRLENVTPVAEGQILTLTVLGQTSQVTLPLAGTFQAWNALAALGLVIASGGEPQAATAQLTRLNGVPGRLQKVATRNSGASIYVDYAHTPDALATILTALRPHVTGNGRLICLFGCGGDRDAGKRPEMGAIAQAQADLVYVTDDNPRSEDPVLIRRAILAACPQAIEIGERARAIREAIANLRQGDVLVLAGKGHERGQIIGSVTLPFDDAEEAKLAVTALDSTALWTSAEIIKATGASPQTNTWSAKGVSIDTRTLAPGDLFIALTGPNHDGHDHLDAAATAGAVAALVHDTITTSLPLVHVTDTTQALDRLGHFARNRSTAKIVAVTGSVGKTGTKDMLRLTLGQQAPTHATLGNLNNQLGAPLSLARMPRDTAYGVFELGMNHTGELTPLTRMVRPHVVVITAIEMAHSEFFADTAAIADAKAEIFLGVEPGGTAILPRDTGHYDRLRQKAVEAGIGTILSFGSTSDADARLQSFTLQAESTQVIASINGTAISYTIGAVGGHWANNSLAVLLAVQALGGDVTHAAQTLSQLTPPKGRGNRFSRNGVQIIDESYNASPASMSAAITALGAAPLPAAARRIAVLGDMLELGAQSPELHAGLAQHITQWGIDLVFTAGPLMAGLHKALPPHLQGGHADSSDGVIALVLGALRPGDVVMVKGSAGSKMSRVVEALGKENWSAL